MCGGCDCQKKISVGQHSLENGASYYTEGFPVKLKGAAYNSCVNWSLCVGVMHGAWREARWEFCVGVMHGAWKEARWEFCVGVMHGVWKEARWEFCVGVMHGVWREAR